MKIAYDSQIFSGQKYGGISRYYYNLIDYGIKNNYDVKAFCNIYRNRYLKKINIKYVNGLYVDDYPAKMSRLFMLGNHLLDSYNINKWNPHVVHETYYSFLSSASTRVPTVVTIFDLINEIWPDKFNLINDIRSQRKKALKRSSHIICISNNTKNDLIKYYDVPSDKVTVIYFGYNDFSIYNTSSVTIDVHRPYFLFVGDRGGYKNFNNFVHAFSKSNYLYNNFSIVTFGGGKYTSEEINLFSRTGLKINNNIFSINGDDNILAYLYKNAICMVYPSIYEGFGLPLLEAMSMGCPVIASNTSCIPEIVENAACLFNPYSIDDIEAKLLKVVDDDLMRSMLVSNGYHRLKEFSWDKCGKETYECYRNLI